MRSRSDQNRITFEEVKRSILARDQEFLNYLKENDIDLTTILISERLELENNGLSTVKEIQNFVDAEPIFDDLKINSENINSLLNKIR